MVEVGQKFEKGPIGPISSIVIKDSLIFCSMPGSGICRSSDNGKNWTENNSGLTNDCVLSLELIGNNIFAGTSGMESSYLQIMVIVGSK
jgi:hypothetical protein